MENKVFIHLDNWKALGKTLYGDNLENYRFKCPACGRITSGKEFKDAGAEPNDIYQCCISRFLNDSSCKWAAYGFLDICKIRVLTPDGKEIPVFEFADAKEEDYVRTEKNFRQD